MLTLHMAGYQVHVAYRLLGSALVLTRLVQSMRHRRHHVCPSGGGGYRCADWRGGPQVPQA